MPGSKLADGLRFSFPIRFSALSGMNKFIINEKTLSRGRIVLKKAPAAKTSNVEAKGIIITIS